MRPLRFVFSCSALALAATPLTAGETVSDQQLGFRLTVPDGFVSAPDRVQGKVIYAFQHPPAGNQKVGTFIAVSRLGGVLGREKLDPREASARGPGFALSSEKWKDFDIEVFRVPEQIGDLKLLTFNAQVPLKPEAIQIAVIGEAGQEEELRGALRSVLRTLDGQTNWLNTEQRVGKLAEGLTRLGMTILVLVAIGVTVWYGVRGRRKGRRTEQGSAPDCGGAS
jgi:hypothetical protein